MADDKNIGERLAGIEVRLTGVDRIEASLEKFRDEHGAWRNSHDRDHVELSNTVTRIDHRSANNTSRIDALEKLMVGKIDKSEAATKVEIEPIKEMLKRIDSHMSWGIKIVIGAVLVAIISGVIFTRPWERTAHAPSASAGAAPPAAKLGVIGPI